MDAAVDRVLAALTQLAQKAGSTVENIFPILVRQAYLAGWLGLVVCAIVTPVVVFGVRHFYRFKSSDKYDPAFNEAGAKIAAIVLAIGGAFFVALTLEASMLRILNPEYYAIKLLLETMSGAVGK